MNVILNLLVLVEYAVLVLLLGLSVWSVSIMIDRRRYFQVDVSETVKKMKDSLNSAATSGAALENRITAVDRLYRSFLSQERSNMEKGLSILATLGANAPFIGLFGTVLGIIQAFSALGVDNVVASSVMSGISLALLATAVGLFVAIPAVVAFNYFSKTIRERLSQCEQAKEQLVASLSLKG